MNELSEAFEVVHLDLLDARDPSGHWEGELAASALSTAVALCALAPGRKRASGTG